MANPDFPDTFDDPDLDQSYDAYAELVKLQRDQPALQTNPYYQALVDTAYARFWLLYRKGDE